MTESTPTEQPWQDSPPTEPGPWEMRFDLPVVWADTPEIGAALVESWVWWFAREMVETANTLLRATKTAPQPEPTTTTFSVQ